VDARAIVAVKGSFVDSGFSRMEGNDLSAFPTPTVISKHALPVPIYSTSRAKAPRHTLLFFVLAHLLRKVAFVSEFSDLVHLRFEEVDVLFFVLEQCHK